MRPKRAQKYATSIESLFDIEFSDIKVIDGPFYLLFLDSCLFP